MAYFVARNGNRRNRVLTVLGWLCVPAVIDLKRCDGLVSYCDARLSGVDVPCLVGGQIVYRVMGGVAYLW